MGAITKQQQKELDNKLKLIKRLHPRKYGRLEFLLSDLGNHIMLGIPGKNIGFRNVTRFMSYECMWFTLDCLENPIDLKIDRELKFLREYEKKDIGA